MGSVDFFLDFFSRSFKTLANQDTIKGNNIAADLKQMLET
jgi:hypothetical protein